ncbi:MAG: PIN domain-containing protein [Ignavibacteriaceae bacterium]|nr:PIN domain-containing protein [Ignavibacteriaceae bacterium]
MIEVFIDTDVILDLLLVRENFYKHSLELFNLLDQKKIEGFTSPIVFANLHYIVGKYTSKAQAMKSLRKIKTMLTVLPTDERIIEQSLESEFNDFEDAIQYFTAINNGIRTLVTRNTDDYKSAKIKIFTPQEFNRIWQNRKE